MVRIIFLLTLLSAALGGWAQVSINADNATADPSAMLDVKASDKGFLAPRMTQAQRTAIIAPATGLLVYQTDGATGFYHYDGLAWQRLMVAGTETDPQVSASTTHSVPKWDGSALTDGSIYDNGTNIGIGTTAPASKLSVNAITVTLPETLDQSHSNSSAVAGIITGSTGPKWQSFTAGMTGNLSKVRLFFVLPAAATTRTISIYIGEGTAGPSMIDGTITVVPGAWNEVSFTEVGISAGVTYTIAIDNGNGWLGQSGDPYAGGRANGNALNDQVFETYVSIIDGDTYYEFTKNGLGINTSSPSAKLEVNGAAKTTSLQTGTLQLTHGAANGYVLQSDATGNASWVDASTIAVSAAESDPEVSSTAANTVPVWDGTSLIDGHIYDNGNIGIGTTVPQQMLSVAGGLNIDQNDANTGSLSTNALTFGSASGSGIGSRRTGGGLLNGLDFYTNSLNRMAITPSGMVGIGTTSPSTLLSVAGGISVDDNQGNNGTAFGNVLTFGGGTGEAIGSKRNSGGNQGGLDFYTGYTNRMAITNSGNVGIGTTAPSATLEVNGTTQTTALQTTHLQMTNGATNGYLLQSDAAGNASWVSPSTLAVPAAETDPQVSSANNNIIPKWNGTTLADGIIQDDGTRVAIGTSVTNFGNNLAYSKFTVASSNTASCDMNVVMANSSVIAPWLNWGKARGTLTSPSIVFTGDELFRLTMNGHDGSQYRESAVIESKVDGSPASGSVPSRIAFYTTAVGGTSTSERMRISNTGNVGIGTTSPSQKLDVNGTTRTTNLQVTNGATNGYLLQSDASGNASWVSPASITVSAAETDPQVSSTTNNKVPKWNGTALTDGLIYDNGTNIGIGTTSPASKLHITMPGNLVVDASYTTTNSILGSAGAQHQVFTAGATGTMREVGVYITSATIGTPTISRTLTVYSGAGTSGTVLGTATQSFTISTTTTEYVFTLPAGISLLSGQKYTLHMNEGQLWNGDTNAGYTGGTSSRPAWDFTFNTYVESDGFQVTNNGVGIGTGAPQQLLSVAQGMNIDQNNANSGTSTSNALTFGSASGEGIGSCRTSGSNQYGLDFYTNYTNRMVITNDGKVGIGTTSPTQGKLVVNGGGSNQTLNYGYLNSAAPTGTASNQTSSYSIYATGRIAATEFNAFSDARIKRVRGLSNTAQDLETLAKIRITDYTFVDTIAKGNKVTKKVIAQELAQVYPNAVSTHTDIVPDIYRLAAVQEGKIMLPNCTLKAGERVKLIFGEGEEMVTIASVDAEGFYPSLPLPTDRIKTEVFVYGREVDDFHTVDYEALSTLNISATQELLKQLNAQQQIISRHDAALAELRALVQQLAAGAPAQTASAQR